MGTKIFAPLQFIYKKETCLDDLVSSKARNIVDETIQQETIGNNFLNGIEASLLTIVSKSLVDLNIPVIQSIRFPYNELRNKLAPSYRKRVKFIDRRGSIWSAVRTYFDPIVRDLQRDEKYGHGFSLVGSVAYSIYLVILASRAKAEAALSPTSPQVDIEFLKGESDFSSESKARLAFLRSVFECFNIQTETPKLKFLPNVSQEDLKDRLAEMLEDAYLLEASRLRRFIGFRQNLAVSKRDLRLLLGTIKKTQAWAKGIVGIGSEILSAPDLSKYVDKILKIIPDYKGNNPPILSPWADIDQLTDQRVVTLRPGFEIGEYSTSIFRQVQHKD